MIILFIIFLIYFYFVILINLYFKKYNLKVFNLILNFNINIYYQSILILTFLIELFLEN